ncbi:MAG: sugar phosphate isomerase/epimerase [Lentisphaerae bacterium]|jgi:sugar phosphate isomerase/epimerase|nr:sugar phosphate isomerase/epimerase [Lentisphaerota bacterium]MBT4817713.1 sugar phosphate isomerase/epimerase [Lentisphaerota bacterium]MBT5609076.1 sugar phosphate isomerase/epimerase [Lentisphaerota bacterium]MBT7053829.1 sugar phosphate isomerase/epimerase [Lentisphaerota bacterium]MBT7842474.1 sugar phosphate isomerase/epimerase [Lentisphaerota bacterium]
MTPTLFSVSYAGFWGQASLDLKGFISHAAELGYPAVMLMAKRPHLSVLDYGPEEIADLAGHCRACGVDVACVAGYTNFAGGVESGEVPFIEMQVSYTRTLAQFAQGLDCNLVRVFTSYERDDLPLAENWTRTVNAIRECCDVAADLGVTVGIQNHHDVAVHSKALLELLADIDRPNCKLMFDAWSPCLRGESAYETARAMAPHAVHTTFADYVRLPRFTYDPALINYRAAGPDLVRAVPMGDGDLANADFLRGLRDGGFDGTAAYEMCSPLRGGGAIENLDACAQRFLEWLSEG